MWFHFVGKWTSVRKESSEKEQLHCRKYSGCNPKSQKLCFGKPQQQDIKSNCHQQNLPPGGIVFHKNKPPNKKIVAAWREVRILIGSYKTMVQVMLFRKYIKRQKSKQRCCQVSKKIVQFTIVSNHTVHRIVRSYKQSGVKVGLNKNM